MATPTTYSYTKATDIPRLTKEIQASTIVTVLDHLNLTGTALDVIFKDAISDADKTTLDALVAAHSGLALPDATPVINIGSAPAPAAFAAKTVGAKGLYKRITGIQQELTEGSNDIVFIMPYNWAKINGLEVIGAETNDHVSLYVLDSTTGTYTGHANYQLNQFGFNVNVAKDYYAYKSEFDADLYINMQIKVVYNSASSKTVGINFILNEVK